MLFLQARKLSARPKQAHSAHRPVWIVFTEIISGLNKVEGYLPRICGVIDHVEYERIGK